MKPEDLLEIEWLAASLRSNAVRLQRAVDLLRGCHDLERAEGKLAAIAARLTTAVPVAIATGDKPAAHVASIAVAARASPALPAGGAANLVAVSSGDRARRSFAVFDASFSARQKLVTKSAGELTRPVRPMVNGGLAIDEIPF